jgi:hypothetical protein
MSEMDFEAQVRSIASGMNYPRTPNIAASVSARLRSGTRPALLSRRLAWSLTILLILISSLMLIPPARAAILEFIQIGVVRIFRSEPTPISPPNQEMPSTIIPVTATIAPTSQPLIPILRNLIGESTLQDADHVFVQEANGKMTILVWLDPQHPDQVLMSLHFLPAGSWAIKKMEPQVIEETNVNGERALWTTGPYPMMVENGDIRYIRMITGHVLIWSKERITYRLETDLPLEEALKIAESLEPISSP